MTRYDVPLEELDRVHVDLVEQVTEQETTRRGIGWAAGALVLPFGDGACPDADGD